MFGEHKVENGFGGGVFGCVAIGKTVPVGIGVDGCVPGRTRGGNERVDGFWGEPEVGSGSVDDGLGGFGENVVVGIAACYPSISRLR